jgi:hypothetical protein
VAPLPKLAAEIELQFDERSLFGGQIKEFRD